jgi:hypothetical protein
LIVDFDLLLRKKNNQFYSSIHSNAQFLRNSAKNLQQESFSVFKQHLIEIMFFEASCREKKHLLKRKS